MKKKILFSLLILFLLVGSTTLLTGQEITEGRIKIDIYEKIGRFIPSYLSDIRSRTYTPLLLNKDPRTSYFSLLVDNKIYRLGDSGVFRHSVSKKDNTATITWKSSELEIIQKIEPAGASTSSVTNGLRLSIEMKNVSEKDLRVGIRYLMDTVLGEQQNAHFYLPDSSVDRESSFSGDSMPAYWISASERNSGKPALQFMTKASGITQPNRLVFANWKRLDDSSWDYQTNSRRDFNLLPYSINDSAAAVYYGPWTMNRGSTKKINIMLGQYSRNGYSWSQTAGTDEISAILKKSYSSSTDGNVEQIENDMLILEDTLEQINKRLAADEPVSDEELEMLEEVIDQLSSRREQ
ncbi:MAG: hypothetical protein K9L68_10875 [Spirochaetales bacterium]|nr:hypothetical protein [Spirochaetales bacterium]